MFRRVLLGAITALVVARPLVLGEDPGLSATRWSDPSNLWLTLGWFLTAASWAGWRVWSRQTAWYVGLVEAGFLVVVGLVFGSAFWAAAYKHPAYLIAWEWLALLTAFFLVRQLVRSLEDSKRLLAALLASGVSLSAYAVYQYTVELPAMQARFAANPEETQVALARQGIFFERDDPKLTVYLQRIQQNNAFATFAHPNAFAGYLALLLPGILGAGVVSYRRLGWSWKTWLAFACFALTAVGLALSKSRGAILGSLLVGAGVLLARAPRRFRRFVLPALLVGLVVLGLVLSQISWGQRGLELAGQSMAKRLGYWKATWAMITDAHHPRHCWLGVGPGNFSRYYPRYMDPAAGEKVIDPHNFALEFWSTNGLFSLLALLATLAVFFWWTRTAWTGTDAHPDDTADQPPALGARVDTRWEFYLGGSIGLLFGFLISGLMASDPSQVADLDPLSKLLFWLAHDRDKLIRVVLCSLLWFPTFGLLETVPWNRTALRLALVAGFTALLLNLTVSGGISYPSVALPLWLVAALALNTLPAGPLPWGSRSWLARVLPLPVAATVAVAFFVIIFYPVTSCFSLLQRVQDLQIAWVAQLDTEWQQVRVVNEPDDKKRQELQKKRAEVIRRNINLVQRFALPTLLEARRQDPTDVLPYLELAFWSGEYWKLALFQGAQAPPPLKIREAAVGWAAKAQDIDPESLESYLTLYRLNLLFAQFAEKQTQSFYSLAARALAQAVKRDPTEARLHFQLADAWFKADNPVEGRAAAREAQRLDELSTEPTRQLSNAQREQIKNWLNAAGPTPPLGSDAPIR